MSVKVTDSWATPTYFYDYYRLKYNIKMDICASENNHKHSKYLTEEDDALTTDRIVEECKGEYVWCNPPYSNVTPWVELAIRNQEQGVGTIMLVKNDPSTKWMERAFDTADVIEFIVGGRVQFIPPEGVKMSSNNFSSVVIVYHPLQSSETKLTYVKLEDIKNGK